MISPSESAKNWILNSGIQNISNDARKNGSFNSWYDIDSKSYPFMYSEITGYGITTLLYLYNIMKKDIFLERAKLAGDWLLNQAMRDCGGVVARVYHDGKVDDRIFAFDNGMVLYGLINLARISNDDAYLDGAKTIAEFLLKMQMGNGLFNAMYDLKTSSTVSSREKWSTQPGSYHAKLTLGLMDTSNVLEKFKYKKSAENLCKAVMQFQDSSGRFVFETDSISHATHFHPHSYTCEGLMYMNRFLNNRFINNAENAIRWAFDQQLQDGGLPTLYSEDSLDENQRVDVLAQMLRLGILLMQEGRFLDYKEKIQLLYKKLTLFQHTNSKHAGGFFYGYENGKKLNHINSWCSFFAMQAIHFYDEYFSNKKVKIDCFV